MDTHRLYSRLWTLSKVQKIKVLMKSSLNTVFKNCTKVTIGTVFSDHCTSKIWIGLSDVVISSFFFVIYSKIATSVILAKMQHSSYQIRNEMRLVSFSWTVLYIKLWLLLYYHYHRPPFRVPILVCRWASSSLNNHHHKERQGPTLGVWFSEVSVLTL